MHLKNKFDVGKFAILAEMQPPKGVNVSAMVNSATRVRNAVDAFLVPEMGNAVMRMSALGGAMILQSRGMETIMQVNCRDRNRIAIQADLLAAYGCGILNVMGVSGEDPSLGDHHQTKAVHDIDLAAMEPLVALPDAVLNNAKPAGAVKGVKLDQCFVGSCAKSPLYLISIF